MSDLIEPYKSAQYYFCFNWPSGNIAFYKYIWTGWFTRTLYTWQNGSWEPSQWNSIKKAARYRGTPLKLDDKKRRELLSASHLDSEELQWQKEQQEFIAKKAAKREARFAADKERAERLAKNKTSELLDVFIRRNKETRN